MVSNFLPAVLSGLVGSNSVSFSRYDFFVPLISLQDYNLLPLTEICRATAIHFCRKKSQMTIKRPFLWEHVQSLIRRTWLDKAS